MRGRLSLLLAVAGVIGIVGGAIAFRRVAPSQC